MGMPDSMNHQKARRLPHENLLIAVMARAVKDYLSRDPREYDTAERFLFPDAGTPGVDIYCAWLEWCPDRLRASLKRHHDAGTRWRSLIED